jgi:hypothetical protein
MDDKESEALTAELETVKLQHAGVQEMMERLDRTRTALRDRQKQIAVALVADPIDAATQVTEMEATLGVKFADVGTEAIAAKTRPVTTDLPVIAESKEEPFPDDRISAEVAAERAAAESAVTLPGKTAKVTQETPHG